MIGAGFMSQGLTNQIVNSMPGMRMVAVYNRKVQRAFDLFDVLPASRTWLRRRRRTRSMTPSGKARPVVTEDAFLLARSEQIDVLVDVDRLGRVRRARRCSKRSSTARTSC